MTKYEIFMWATVLFHTAVVLTMMAALFVVIFCSQWYVWFPLWVMAINMSYNSDCPLTALENYYREKAGKPTIPGFIYSHTFGYLGNIKNAVIKIWRYLCQGS